MANRSPNYKTGKIRKDNQKTILRAAEKEFAQFGFKGASMMSIAKRAKLPRPNLHYYFDNKLHLYNQVLVDILELWNDAFNQITADDDPAEAIGAYIKAKVHYSQTNPLASRIFANEIIHGAPHLKDYLNQDYRQWLSSKAAVIQQWIEQGKMDPIDPLYLIFLIWSSTQYYADYAIQITSVMNKSGLTDEDFGAVTENLTHIILKGCGIKIKNSPILDR